MKDRDFVSICVVGENFLYLLNVLEDQYIKSSLEEGGQCANCYGIFIEIDGRHELAAIYGYNQTVNLFFRKSYRVDTPDLSVILKDGFFKNRFQMFLNGEKEIDIKYKQIDINNDIFVDLKEWLEITPREKLISKLEKQAEFFSETDSTKRRDLKWQREIFGE